jgi:hypothetical protein
MAAEQALTYVVTFIPEGHSEPEESHERVETGDPDTDADRLIDDYAERGDEVIHIRWSNGATTYAAPGIDR